MHQFIGREEELQWLKSLFDRRSSSFVVIRGRRRVGKSRLIYEFCKDRPHHIITGLPPSKRLTKKEQLGAFADQVSESFNLPRFQPRDWWEALTVIGKLCAKGPKIIALDEISWIGSKDPTFLGHLKNAWDQYFSQNPQLILIVCGSVSSWIEKYILTSTGFVGRITGSIDLKELPVQEAVKFWSEVKEKTSLNDILQTLSVTGGIPRYLEAINPKLPATINIKHLCFDSKGLLFNEFDQIFSDLFSIRASVYHTVLEELSNGSYASQEIATELGISHSSVNDALHDLVQAGFVAEDPTWEIKTGKASRLKKFRLSDNYVRFYLKVIARHKAKVVKGIMKQVDPYSLPGWSTIMGLQFEALVLNNIAGVVRLLGIQMGDVEMYGPFFQRKTSRLAGCQIDLMIQTRHRTLFLCEIKFSKDPIGMAVVQEIKKKHEAISYPRDFSLRTALIHVSGVTGDLVESHALDYIINFSDLLAESLKKRSKHR